MLDLLARCGTSRGDLLFGEAQVAPQFHFIEQRLIRGDPQQHRGAASPLGDDYRLVRRLHLFDERGSPGAKFAQRVNIPGGAQG